MEHKKIKSVAKLVESDRQRLQNIVSKTMDRVAAIVGATLGPGGQPVLIERSEEGLPPFVTKDGVTVFRAIGFPEAAAHCVMEVMRDAAIRTANEAGDGTTTATVLAEAIMRYVRQYCADNPQVSPQKVVREMGVTFRDEIEPAVRGWSRKARLDKRAGRKLLRAVARVSANGDDDLAAAVMECFDITGDEGNVTIVESSGPTRYEVERVRGYAVPTGYEESCGRYSARFLNDHGNQRCVLEKPLFLLYHGVISDIHTIQSLLEKVGAAWAADDSSNHNVVVVAIGFSDSVLAQLALNFETNGTINVFPLMVPLSPQTNGQIGFLQDLAAVTGATILDLLSRAPANATLVDLGRGVDGFEAYRFRSSVLGYADETLLGLRVDELNSMLENPESQLDAVLLRERRAKLSGGIAKLRVIGSSNGELKERRDRAEDAVCAVRGAITKGVLPGGGWTLLALGKALSESEVNSEILRPALLAPVAKLFSNAGFTDQTEVDKILSEVSASSGDDALAPIVFDFLAGTFVDPYRDGLLDSTPAVLEAIRSSLSIAGLMGTLGGLIVQPRDEVLERSEANASADWDRLSNSNPADERA